MNIKKAFLLLSIFALLIACAKNEKISPVTENAQLEQLADGFAFTEGPVADKDGNVYFSDIPNSRIYKWTNAATLSTFRENSGRSNGLAFDKDGNLIVCEGGNRRLTSIDPQGNITVLANQFEGKKLNSPNDLWIDPKGGIYFTDPRYGDRSDLELDGEYVFYLTPNREQLIKVIENMVRPNGIVGTPGGKNLYVADRGADSNWVYVINEDGTLSNKKFFCLEGSDGMTIDVQGNIYITSPRREPYFMVSIFDKEGKKIGDIQVPEMPTNVCFWGKDRSKLFITDRKTIHSIRMNVKGE
ncbi:SMP-30/gluconolactonase/LRE family protein [candidate division KSB1 bacterium]|nr:SMP-30/gluconolactonase/LRE family protein [candidate division KSB1 bacterium]MBL7092720.1 SMP-30/gluconolactonase/LRE family protein [candidate division KSB1 bacterium]